MSDAIVSIRNVTKAFPGGVTAVDNVSLDIAQNEFFALLGPSGCGKTTLLRMISGLETPTSGQIIIGGEDMAFTPPNKRPTNMVFQSYAVFPHMTVEQNVGFGLRKDPRSKAEKAAAVAEADTERSRWGGSVSTLSTITGPVSNRRRSSASVSSAALSACSSKKLPTRRSGRPPSLAGATTRAMKCSQPQSISTHRIAPTIAATRMIPNPPIDRSVAPT